MFNVSSIRSRKVIRRFLTVYFYYFSVGGHFRRKAVAKDWHANGGPLSIVGKLEILQASEYDITNVEVDLKGLVKNSGYHVHIVSC